MLKLLPTFVIPDFLSSTELELMQNLIQSEGTVKLLGIDPDMYGADRQQNSGLFAHIWALTTNGNNHRVEEFFLSKLTPILPCTPLLYDVWFQTQVKPLGFHTDYDDIFAPRVLPNDQLPYYTILIPSEDTDIDLYTILANEGSSKYCILKDYIEHDHALPLPMDQCITSEFFNQYLSHCPVIEREYFSLYQNCKWKKGQLLAFDRRRFHAGHNYLKDNASHKNFFLAFSFVNADEYKTYINSE